jgi:Bacterial Ig-like domain (group 3)
MPLSKAAAMSGKVQFVRLFVLLGLLSTVAQVGFAQSPNPPLNFGNNFFVTGDYLVAGAYGMTTNFKTTNGVSYAVGTISVPDNNNGIPNPGITGTNQVPQGAQIVAALLYWQTVEKVGVKPGGPGSGQNGYFRPLLNGGPAAPGYAISGTNVSSSNTVSWSSGGCGGGSTGKLLRTYRADVGGGLPLDSNGNSIANTSFEVRLPSVGNSTPLTLGATLVVIYRIPSGAGGPTIPLNSIVIYDGDYAQGNAQLIMTQQLQGFYDADHNPVSRLTHIVGNGKSNKFQTVYLGSGANSLLPLPSLYGNKLPPFPGWYGTWDNPTWTFTNASTTNPGVLEEASNATTKVVPFQSNQGCVSWGAVIVSTTVKNSDNDGNLDSWKRNQGYCDAALNNGLCNGPGDPAWVDLTGSAKGQQDVFLQYDYMCSTVTGPNSCTVGGVNADYSFDPRLATDVEDGLSPHANAVDKVVAAYATHNIHLHAIPGNAIEESQPPNISCLDSDSTCPFPNEPGTVGFREGLAYIKNQTIEPQTGLLGCDPSTDPNPCIAVFPHGRKDSYHYALFSHGVGLPNWFLSDGSISGVSQSGNTVTFTTSSPHGIKPILGDSLCSSPNYIGRVTVVFAITNQNLNGTYCAKPANPPSPNKFAITVPGSPTTTSYTLKTDPNLAVANGQVTSMSGYSDVGGQNSVISLGYGGWGPANNPASDGSKWQMKAGTLMHELGHTMALTHGGTFYNKLPNNPSDYTPNFETNCKPNVQSVMSYLFQFDLLEVPGQFNAVGNPLMVVDYSEDPPPLSPNIPTLTESAPEGPGILNNLSYAKTAWFQLTSFAGGTPVSPHCDGTPLVPGEAPVAYVPGSTSDFFWTTVTGEDINFNGNSSDVMHGHNEWEGTPAESGAGPAPGLDLRQVSAVGTISTIGPGGEAGGLKPAGGGGGLKPAGGGGGLQPAGGGGGLKPAGGGGGLKPAGGGGLSAEITHETANSYTRPPRDLAITQEEASPRLIDLSWFVPTFGQIVQYNIYRSDAGVPFHLIHSNTGNPPATTYQDTVTCNTGGYRYRVTAFVFNDVTQQLQESVPSNIVPATGQNLLTGCYVVTNFSSPASAVQGSLVPIPWTLTDDFYITPGAGWANAAAGHPVTNTVANTLVANGPLPGNCTAVGSTTILLKGTPTAQSGTSTFANTNPNTGQFTFSWDTDGFCAGSYTFTLTLDSTQTQTTTSSLQLQIDINDTDNTPHITILPLPAGIVGLAYSNTLTEDGGTAPFTWTVTGLPSGISQQPLNTSPTLSGTACVAGPYNVTATVTDSKANSGMQGFTLQVNKANTTTGVTSNANPSVFQQMVTFTVTVAPQYSCAPTGTVTLLDGGSPIASNLPLSGGTAMFTTSALSVGVHSITASYGGDANFNSSTSAAWSQTENKASTMTTVNSVSPSPAFVGQPITVSYSFAVVAPGAGSPIPPSGNITVSASDGSSCMAPAALGSGACTLAPTPANAGTVTFTITYSGDGNFVGSGANGNYTVYQLAFTTQPSNTGVGLTITPAVQVAAQDNSNNTLTTFTGSITLAIGSGPGTLSGTTTQNAVSGVATFSDLGINKMATAYALVASLTAPAVAATVTSNAFNVDAVLFAGTDQNTLSGNPLPDQMGRFTINGTTVTGNSILSVPYHINGMAQGGNFLYAGDPNSNTLQRIDFNGNALSSVTAGFPNTCCNEDMAFDAAGNVLWHANNSETTPPSGGEIDKLDPTTGAVITAYPLSDVAGMTFVGNTIWITQWSAREVGTWDPGTNTFTMKFATPANAGGLAYDPVNGILWVGLQGGSVVPYDLNGNQQGPGFSPFGAITDTVDGLEFVSQIP